MKAELDPAAVVTPPAAVSGSSPQLVDADVGQFGNRAIRGFQVGRLRVRHIRSEKAGGFGYDEGDVHTQTLLAASRLYNRAGQSERLRVIVGRHSLWFLY